MNSTSQSPATRRGASANGDTYAPPDLTPEERMVWERMPRRARESVQSADLRIRAAAMFRRLWELQLTESERSRFGGNCESAWRKHGTVGLWMRARGFTNRFAAVADLTGKLDILPPDEVNFLIRETSLAAGSSEPIEDRPVWCARRGVLSFRNAVVRRVRLLKTPSNVQRILDAFQNAGWPNTINNPLQLGQTQLHYAVYQLNRDLEAIRFHGADGGATIAWEEANIDSE